MWSARSRLSRAPRFGYATAMRAAVAARLRLVVPAAAAELLGRILAWTNRFDADGDDVLCWFPDEDRPLRIAAPSRPEGPLASFLAVCGGLALGEPGEVG